MSGLADFLGGAGGGNPASLQPRPGETAEDTVNRVIAAVQEENRPAVPVDENTAEPAEKAFGVVQVTLPSGIEVYYQEGPKRLYRLRQPDVLDFEDWVEVPSMSTVTDILDAPGLVYWGEECGITAVQEILRNGWADVDFVTMFNPGDTPDPRKPWWGGDHLKQIAKQKKLSLRDRRDATADRGNNVHTALEGWAMSGNLPDPDLYPPAERGYIQGLVKFLTESKIEPVQSEVIVASTLHKVAGRFDLIGKSDTPFEAVYHLTPKSEKKKTFKPGSRLFDLKTSKGVFLSQHLQTQGYWGCMEESGREKPEHASVLRVTVDGRYELVDCAAEWLDFWWLRGLYDATQEIEKRAHQNYRKEF